jgi:small subunit ribosomal protein S27Ae
MPRGDYYDDEGQTEKEMCPRCGDTFLADHDDRQVCGKCGYTEWE